MIVFTTIVLSILSVIYFYLKTKRRVDLAERFPGPPTHYIFENLFNFNFTDLKGLSFTNKMIIKWVKWSHQRFIHSFIWKTHFQIILFSQSHTFVFTSTFKYVAANRLVICHIGLQRETGTWQMYSNYKWFLQWNYRKASRLLTEPEFGEMW